MLRSIVTYVRNNLFCLFKTCLDSSWLTAAVLQGPGLRVRRGQGGAGRGPALLGPARLGLRLGAGHRGSRQVSCDWSAASQY